MSASGRAICAILALAWTVAAFATPAEALSWASRCPSEHDADSFSTKGAHLGGPCKGTKYLYDFEDRLLSEERDGGATSIAYAYANRGDMTSKTLTAGGVPESHSYITDYKSRITAYSGPTASWQYIYAPSGDRIAKQNLGTGLADENQWDLISDGDVLASYHKSGSSEVFDSIYVSPGVDGRLARIDVGGAASYFMNDVLNSVHQVTSVGGGLVATDFNDAWGNPIDIGLGIPGGLNGRFSYTNRERDSESGMMFYRARAYDPMTARFVSRDPVPVSHLYVYAENNPVQLTDPSGNEIQFADDDETDKQRINALLDKIENFQLAKTGAQFKWVPALVKYIRRTKDFGLVIKMDAKGLKDKSDAINKQVEKQTGLPSHIEILAETSAAGSADLIGAVKKTKSLNLLLQGFKEYDASAKSQSDLETAQVERGTRTTAATHVGEEYLAETILHEFLHAFFAARIGLGETNDMKNPELQALVKTVETYTYKTDPQGKEQSLELTEASFVKSQGYESLIDTYLIGSSIPIMGKRSIRDRNPGAVRVFLDDLLRASLQEVKQK